MSARRIICLLISIAIFLSMLVSTYADTAAADVNDIELGSGKDVYFAGTTLKELEELLNTITPSSTRPHVGEYEFVYENLFERDSGVFLPPSQAKINSIEIESVDGMPPMYTCHFTLDGVEYYYNCMLLDEYSNFIGANDSNKKTDINGRELILQNLVDDNKNSGIGYRLDGKYYFVIGVVSRYITKDEIAKLPDELFNAQRKTLRELRTAPMGGDEIAIIEPLEACNAECE